MKVAKPRLHDGIMEWEMTMVIILILHGFFNTIIELFDWSLRICDSYEITALTSICFRFCFSHIRCAKPASHGLYSEDPSSLNVC